MKLRASTKGRGHEAKKKVQMDKHHDKSLVKLQIIEKIYFASQEKWNMKKKQRKHESEIQI